MLDYQDILDHAFPESSYSNTVMAIGEGLALADDAFKGLPFLDNAVGKDIRGLVRRAGVMFRLHQLCEAGDLPFITEFSPMPIGSWHWLEIRSGQCRGYLIKTADKEAFPADTPNQQDKRHSNQYDMFDDPKVISLPKQKLFTAWLCYGTTRNGALSHALWGLPSGRDAETWLARKDALNAVRTEVVQKENSKRPTMNPRDAMKFKDEIRAALEKQKNIKDAGDES